MSNSEPTDGAPVAPDAGRGAAPITRRELRRAERAFTVGARGASAFRPVRSLATVGAVLALLAGVAIPAYAATTSGGEASASPSTHDLAEQNAQSLTAGDDVKIDGPDVSAYSATTPEEIQEKKQKEAAAERAAAATSAASPRAASSAPVVVSDGFANPLPVGSYSLGKFWVHGFGNYVRGHMHMGQDMLAPAGTEIRAAIDGTIGTAGWSGGFGNLVTIAGSVDGSSVTIKNGHMSSVAVSPGQTVKKGDVIGYVGSTGSSDVNHLHVEVWLNGSAYDPQQYLPIA